MGETRVNLKHLLEDIRDSYPFQQYIKAANTHSENYHIILCVAWVLSNFLETEKSPLAFLYEFLRIWGQQ